MHLRCILSMKWFREQVVVSFVSAGVDPGAPYRNADPL